MDGRPNRSVFEKLYFLDGLVWTVGRNKAAFSNVSGLKRVFEKLYFLDGLVRGR